MSRKIKIYFEPFFMWNIFGKVQVYADQIFLREIKKTKEIYVEEATQVDLRFTKDNAQTNIHIENNEDGRLELVCGVKYQVLRYMFKFFIFIGLLAFYYFIVKINNRSITNQDYKFYYIIGFIVFLFFCLDSLMVSIIQRNPQKYIYIKPKNNKNV